jgi:hypothetical protein
MAADVSAQLASGLLSNLYEQIDPLRLAEYDRANRIAEHYGERIKTKNVKEHAISQLLEKYPAHEFCIDAIEAKQLFGEVEQPSKELEEIGTFLKPFAEGCLNQEETAVFYLGEPKQKPSEKEHENKPENGKSDTGGAPVSGDGNGNATVITTVGQAVTIQPEPTPQSRA